MAELQKMIEELLSELDAELSVQEIAKHFEGDANLRAVKRAITQMLKYHEIDYVKIDVKTAQEKYGKNIKHGLRLYFI